MNKADLIEAIANDAGINKTQAEAALSSFCDTTAAALAKGDKLSLIGFGTFSTSDRPARTGRNPQTGKEIQIAAKTVVKFKPGKALAEKVN